MDNDPLDSLLAALAKEPFPLPPANLESRVWREIHARRSRPAGMVEWLSLLLATWSSHWKPTYAAVAVAACVGVLMGHLSDGPAPALASQASNQTGESLGLGVFSVDPPALPSSLLARQP